MTTWVEEVGKARSINSSRNVSSYNLLYWASFFIRIEIELFNTSSVVMRVLIYYSVVICHGRIRGRWLIQTKVIEKWIQSSTVEAGVESSYEIIYMCADIIISRSYFNDMNLSWKIRFVISIAVLDNGRTKHDWLEMGRIHNIAWGEIILKHFLKCHSRLIYKSKIVEIILFAIQSTCE